MTQRDLTRNRDEAHCAESPGGFTRTETDLDQIFRLVDLDGIPGEEPAEIAGG